jgi:isoleucyl-tRNA synthetase
VFSFSPFVDNSTGKVYIMMEARLEALFKKEDEYTILEK